MSLDSLANYAAWRTRVHERICVPARSCTCPGDIGIEALTEARELASRNHARYEHPGDPKDCRSPHDVLCKAVWP